MGSVIRRPSGIAAIDTPRRFYIFMCRITISHFSFLIQAKLANVIKGQHVPWAPPSPLLFRKNAIYYKTSSMAV